MSVLVTLPICNEAPRLEANFKELYSFLEDQNWRAQIILAEDGSHDGSFEIAERLSSRFDNVRVFHNGAKLGRGRAIRDAWSRVSGDVYVFMDADLATDLRFLPSVVKMIKESKYDLVTGSRYAKGANVSRPTLRLAISLVYNALVRWMFSTGVADHQCGFKAFSKRAVDVILKFTHEDSWTWDTEAVIVLRRFNLNIGEIKVEWKEKKYRRTSFSRLISDMILHSLALLRILLAAKKSRSNSRPGKN